jgi:hypothetical protein
MSCQKSSDNKFFDCPPRMSDGRHFTDYRPSCDANLNVKKSNGINNSYDYRVFLTQNAEKIMAQNRADISNSVLCSMCDDNTVPPPSIVQVCNEQKCTFQPGSLHGIGLVIKNENNPVKCNNVTAPKNNVCYSRQDQESYLPKNGNLPQRFASPGFGTPYTGGDYIN